MKTNCQVLNQGYTVVVRGIAYDFPDTLMADAFVQAVETGAIPPQAASCLLDRAHVRQSVDH
jgi:hypothetical protein